jgi:hypothetical protein
MRKDLGPPNAEKDEQLWAAETKRQLQLVKPDSSSLDRPFTIKEIRKVATKNISKKH